MTHQQCYIAAAKLVSNNLTYSCKALHTVCARRKAIPCIYKYSWTFFHSTDAGFRPGRYGWWDCPRSEKNQLCRSLALLFMAEMEKDK